MCEEHAFERAAFASSFCGCTEMVVEVLVSDELTIVVVVERAETVE